MKPSATSKTVLFRPPGALGMPTSLPSALAAECALRFAWMRFGAAQCWSVEPKQAAATQLGPKAVPCVCVTDGATTTIAEGAEEILALVARNGRLGREQLCDLELGQCAAVEAIAATRLFPVIEYLLFANDEHWNSAFRGTFPGYSLFSSRLTAKQFRYQKLQELKLHHNLWTDAQAAASAEKHLLALEQLMLGPCRSGEPFYLATKSPTQADCFAYAAASFFFHGDYKPASLAQRLQVELLPRCPRLRVYVEALRAQFFEHDAAQYFLRSIPASALSEQPDLYADGRTRAVVLTALFAVGYFLLVNGDVILSLWGATDQPLSDVVQNNNSAPEEKKSEPAKE